MRTTLMAVTVLAGLGAYAMPVRAQGLKIAYLNSQRILQEAPGSQEAQAAIQQEQARLDARIQAMSDSLQVMVDDYQKQSVLLSPDEKRNREGQISARQAAMQQRLEILRQDAQTRQQELMDPVMQRVEAAIEALRAEGGYAIIFDAASGAMVSADTTLDLTSQVIARLRTAAGTGPASNR